MIIFIVALIFLWSNGFNLQIFSFSSKFRVLQELAAILIGIIGLWQLVFGKKNFLPHKYFKIFVAMFFIIFSPTIYYLIFLNGLGFIEVLSSGRLYFGLLILLFLMPWNTSTVFVYKLNKAIFLIVTALIFLIIVSTQFTALLPNLFETTTRFGQTRVTLEYGMIAFVQYSFCYALVQTTKNANNFKKKTVYFLLLFMFCWFFSTISMGRRAIFLCIIIMIYYWMFYLKTIKKMKSILILTLLIIITPVIFPQSIRIIENTYYSYTSAVGDVMEDHDTIEIRKMGMKYYLNLFYKSGLIGLGIQSNKLPATDPYRYGRLYYLYNPNDHGIVAVIYQFGFQGILFTCFLIAFLFKDLKLIEKHSSFDNRSIAITIHLYLVLSIFGLLQIFWKNSNSFLIGLILFMVWRMKKDLIAISQ